MRGFGDGRSLRVSRRIYGTEARLLAERRTQRLVTAFDLLAPECLLVRWMFSQFEETTWS